MARTRRKLAEIRVDRDRLRDAAVSLRRTGKSAAEVGEVLGLSSARRVRELCQGVDLSASPDSAPVDPAKPGPKRKAAPRRKAPRSFKRRNQPALGKMLRPIILEPARGGFAISPEMSSAGLGPNVPVDGWGDPMGDGRHLLKVTERIIDLGTTSGHDQRRYDARRDVDQARSDESWDDMEIPDNAVRAVLFHENGSETEVDL